MVNKNRGAGDGYSDFPKICNWAKNVDIECIGWTTTPLQLLAQFVNNCSCPGNYRRLLWNSGVVWMTYPTHMSKTTHRWGCMKLRLHLLCGYRHSDMANFDSTPDSVDRVRGPVNGHMPAVLSGHCIIQSRKESQLCQLSPNFQSCICFLWE